MGAIQIHGNRSFAHVCMLLLTIVAWYSHITPEDEVMA